MGVRLGELSARYGRALYKVALAAIFVAFALICAYQIAGPWTLGHNGFNGAAFWQAATNSLRFHVVGQAQYHMALTPPPAEQLYTHHPMLLHGHLVINQWLFGRSELAGRLVPAIYSLLDLVLVWQIARRFFGRAQGLLAALIYALTPLNLVCANMINHEQGGLFWCLATVYAYLSWRETKSVRWAWALLLSVVLAQQFDWPAYYVAFFIGVDLLVHGVVALARRRPGARQELTWLLVFSAVVLANAGLFLAWIVHTRGSFSEMMGAYAARTAPQDGYWLQVWAREHDLHGSALVGLLALYVAWFAVRAVRGRARRADFAVWCFILGQLIHSSVFKQAGAIHAYWVYYLGPALALGGASVLADLGRALEQTLRAPRWLLASACLILALLQAHATRAAFLLGTRDGGFAYLGPGYDDQHREVALMRWVAARYPRGRAKFVVDPQLGMRIEQAFYLDAPMDTLTSPASWPSSEDGPSVLIADLCQAPDASSYQDVVARHGGDLLDACYLVVSSAGRAGSLQSYRTLEAPRPWWWWLVSVDHPPETIVATGPVSPSQLFAVFSAIGERTAWSGEASVPARALRCPPNSHVLEIEAQAVTAPRGRFVAALRIRCSAQAEGAVASRWLGLRNHDRGAGRLRCSDEQEAVGLSATTDGLISSVALICAEQGGASLPSLGARMVGEQRGAPVTLLCPKGQPLVGIDVKAGALVDALAALCGPSRALTEKN